MDSDEIEDQTSTTESTDTSTVSFSSASSNISKRVQKKIAKQKALKEARAEETPKTDKKKENVGSVEKKDIKAGQTKTVIYISNIWIIKKKDTDTL
jgi:hypothetical protein